MKLKHLSISRSVARAAAVFFAALAVFGSTPAQAQQDKEFRVGWQKGGTLAVVKARGTLDKRLADLGVSVRWIEFTAGPQMLEALNVGSLDFGLVGETPPVFAQAAGADLLYVAVDPPAPQAERLLVPKDSPIRSVAELKGKRIALNKGSNVHYLLVKLLEREGLKYSDVNVVYLPPADARAAFESGSVDAWAIWEPFASAAEAQIGARTLADGAGAANNHIFYIGTRTHAERNPQVLDAVVGVLHEEGQWVAQHIQEAAAILAPQISLSQEITEAAVGRYQYGTRLLSDEVVRQQQAIADVFYELKLIPKKLDVASVVWQPKR
jgi:sulfonate transport system substrate-binding protein